VWVTKCVLFFIGVACRRGPTKSPRPLCPLWFQVFSYDGRMLKAIIFDYGKVLTFPPTPEDWARLAAVFGVPVEKFQQAYWALRDKYDRAVYDGVSYWSAVAEQLGKKISQEGVARLIALDNAQWTVANPEMLDFAWRAKETGLKIGILSNMQNDMLAAMRKQLAWLDRFDHQTYTCEVGAIKPEPESYYIVLHALEVKPGEAIFLDDKQVNIDGARAVGMHASLFEGDMATVYDAVDNLGAPLSSRKAAE
jgi:putative hydrolase of the HAD superfamily